MCTRELVGVRVIRSHELRFAFHQVAVKARFRPSRSSFEMTSFAFCFFRLLGFLDLRAIVALSALDRGKLSGQRPPATVQVLHDASRCASRPGPRFALSIRADAVIGN
jgi:hypothetical protein